MSDNQNSQPDNQHPNDGSRTPRPENQHGEGTQQQGKAPLTSSDSDSSGNHGGNRGGDQHADTSGARGSSGAGAQLSADQKNQGGGSDAEEADQTQNTTDYKSDYGTGNAAPSPANDGGTIDDANNS